MFRFGDPGGRIYTSVGTSNVNLLAHWSSCILAANAGLSVSSGNGRLSGSCLRWTVFNTSQGNASYITKTLDSQATWGIAFAVKVSSLPTAGNSLVLVSLLDTATSQVDLRMNNVGALYVTRNGTVLGTSAFSVSSGAWCHVEMKININPTTGTVYLAVNGIVQLNLTGQNTRNSANSSANVIFVGMNNTNQATLAANATLDFDDIIIYDGQATDANGFADITGPIGDCGLVWLLPTGVGTTTQFTPDSGSNYARVNEATPDGNTSYVDNGTVGNIDTYAIADLGGTASIVKSLAVVSYARKTDAGSRGMKTELRSAGANAANATEIGLADTFLYYFQTWGQDPNNGSPINWTPTSVNAVEAGQVVSS